MRKQTDEILKDYDSIEGKAWMQLLYKFSTDYGRIAGLKKSIEDPRHRIFTKVDFQKMLRQAIDERPFSLDVLYDYIGLQLPKETREDDLYRLLEMSYDYIYGDGELDAIEYFLQYRIAPRVAKRQGMSAVELMTRIEKRAFLPDVVARIKERHPDLLPENLTDEED